MRIALASHHATISSRTAMSRASCICTLLRRLSARDPEGEPSKQTFTRDGGGNIGLVVIKAVGEVGAARSVSSERLLTSSVVVLIALPAGLE